MLRPVNGLLPAEVKKMATGLVSRVADLGPFLQNLVVSPLESSGLDVLKKRRSRRQSGRIEEC